MLQHIRADFGYNVAWRTAKNILTLLALGIAMLGETTGIDMGTIIVLGVTAIGWVVGVAGVAAVMRYRVNEFSVKLNEMDKWKESHDDLHSSQAGILAKLTTLCDTSQERLRRLEETEDRRRIRRD